MSYGRATFEFAGEDGLVLDENDVFVIVARDDGSGWTKVTDKHGTTGFAPTNYFEVISEQEFNESSAVVSNVPRPVYVTHSIGNNQSNEEDHESDGVYADINYEEVRKKETVDVLYDFDAQDGSLSIKAGDVCDLLDRSNPEWWKVTINGRTGYVPHNYVSINEGDYAIAAFDGAHDISTNTAVVSTPIKITNKPLYQSTRSALGLATSAPKVPNSSGSGNTSFAAQTSSNNSTPLLGMSPTERRRREMEAAKKASKPATTSMEPVSEVSYAQAQSITTPSSSTYMNASLSKQSSVASQDDSTTADDIQQAQHELDMLTQECDKLAMEVQQARVQKEENRKCSGELQNLLTRIQTIKEAAAY